MKMHLCYSKEERTTRIEYKNVKGVEIPVIKYKIYDRFPELVTGFSTRLGGVSTGHLSSMNLSFSRGDDRENVMENHRRFAEAVGYEASTLVFSDQVHDICIRCVDKDDRGKGIIKESDIKATDGLVTNESNTTLMTFYADCVPLYAYDPVKKVVALAHSGWKGTVAHIGSELIRHMEEKYGSKAKDIYCAIGPSICRKCYEVSEDVAHRFREEFDEAIYDKLVDEKGNGKFMLDLWLACYYNFILAGVEEAHIAMPDICTCCNSEVLFSHRASHGMRGNLAAVAMLKGD